MEAVNTTKNLDISGGLKYIPPTGKEFSPPIEFIHRIKTPFFMRKSGPYDARLRELMQPTPSIPLDHAGLDNLTSGDPHTQYRLESADHTHQSTGLQAGQLDHGLAMSAASLLDDDHTIYQKESEKGAASGYASLNGSTLVTENPANATATPTASKIPIADTSGTLNSWVIGFTDVSLDGGSASEDTGLTMRIDLEAFKA
jgi:hypothetical protein